MLVDYVPTSFPGMRLPHVRLGDGTTVFDHLGDGLTLVRVGPDAPSAVALITTAADAGVPLVVLDVDAATVGDAWDRVPLLLVRPDQHIAWRSTTDPSPTDAAGLLTTVTGRT